MHILSVEYPGDLLLTTGKSPDEREHELALLPLLLALKLFELRRLSLGKTAELARRSKASFLFELGRLGVAAIDLDEDQIADELRDE
jgi:predicted HTH domain antitoxin